LATGINEEHAAARADTESAVEHARRAGSQLRTAKTMLRHGQWLPWLATNCPDLSARTAQVYMRVARHPNAHRVADLALRKAIKALAKSRHQRPPGTLPTPAAAPPVAFVDGGRNPYFQNAHGTIYHGDGREFATNNPKVLVVTDPPYNRNFEYDEYGDNLDDEQYAELLRATVRAPSVVLHYPEGIANMVLALGIAPQRCAAWVYHGNQARQHRQLAWFGIKPDFSLVRQPYRNPDDRRIRQLIDNGSGGAALYDWWLVEQVKNYSPEKTEHPCQIPVQVMENAIAITPAPLILDPFMGSGTTLLAAQRLGRRAIGVEQSERYCEIAATRLEEELREGAAAA
jgi:hypothetical protein